jgi:TIR domain-containing protein
MCEMLMSSASNPMKVFVSYAHDDAALWDKLKKQLTILTLQGQIDTWYDGRIGAGAEWSNEIAEQLDKADLILLLMSPDFLSSQYIFDVEVKRAMERHEAGAARVIPVILRPCLWHCGVFAKLQALPSDGEPVASKKWRNQDTALYEVALGIANIVTEFVSKQEQVAGASSTHAPLREAQREQITKNRRVDFETERKPKPFNLQRVIHEVLAESKHDSDPCISFIYHPDVLVLLDRTKCIYENYEEQITMHRGRASLQEYNMLHETILSAERTLENLPRLAGLIIKQLRVTDYKGFIFDAVNRFIELKMTSLLSGISKFQFDSDQGNLFLDYNGGSLYDYVAKIDGSLPDKFLSYRIVFSGDPREVIIAAPANSSVYNEFNKRGAPYFPPISFLTYYVFPQIFWWYEENPDKWNLSGRCESMYIKDLHGDYV